MKTVMPGPGILEQLLCRYIGNQIEASKIEEEYFRLCDVKEHWSKLYI